MDIDRTWLWGGAGLVVGLLVGIAIAGDGREARETARRAQEEMARSVASVSEAVGRIDQSVAELGGRVAGIETAVANVTEQQAGGVEGLRKRLEEVGAGSDAERVRLVDRGRPDLGAQDLRARVQPAGAGDLGEAHQRVRRFHDGVAAHERAAAAGLDDTERLELLVGAGHGAGREVELVGEGAHGRQPEARLEGAGVDLRPEAVAHLLERRDAGGRVDGEVHAAGSIRSSHTRS